jgi:hypothetical protein
MAAAASTCSGGSPVSRRNTNDVSSNNLVTVDEDSPHIIGTDGKQMWATGGWSATIQGQNFGPTQIKGYWSVIREGDVWKIRMLTSNVTPAPAATPSATTTPSSK